MTFTAETLMNALQFIIVDLKQDIFHRFDYNLDENLLYLDLTRHFVLLQNAFNEQQSVNYESLPRSPNYH